MRGVDHLALVVGCRAHWLDVRLAKVVHQDEAILVLGGRAEHIALDVRLHCNIGVG